MTSETMEIIQVGEKKLEKSTKFPCEFCLNIPKVKKNIVSAQQITNELAKLNIKIMRISEFECYFHATFTSQEDVSKVILQGGELSINGVVFRVTKILNGNIHNIFVW